MLPQLFKPSQQLFKINSFIWCMDAYAVTGQQSPPYSGSAQAATCACCCPFYMPCTWPMESLPASGVQASSCTQSHAMRATGLWFWSTRGLLMRLGRFPSFPQKEHLLSTIKRHVFSAQVGITACCAWVSPHMPHVAW